MRIEDNDIALTTKQNPRDFIAFFIRKHGNSEEQRVADVSLVTLGVKAFITRVVAYAFLLVVGIGMLVSGRYDFYTCVGSITLLAGVIFFGTRMLHLNSVNKKFTLDVSLAALSFFFQFRIWILDQEKNYFNLRKSVEDEIVRLLIGVVALEINKPESLDECARHQGLLEISRSKYTLASSFLVIAPYAELYGRARDCYLQTTRRLNSKR